MDVALATLAKKMAPALLDAALELKPHVHGEWLGKLVYEVAPGGLWHVRQKAEDPLRLLVPELGFEYAFQGGFFSDGGSIPKVLQGIPKMRLKPDSFPKSYFKHDHDYERGGCWVRAVGTAVWTWMPLTREMADCLLYIGLTAEDATLAEAVAIFQGVRLGGEAAWKRCRDAELNERPRT